MHTNVCLAFCLIEGDAGDVPPSTQSRDGTSGEDGQTQGEVLISCISVIAELYFFIFVLHEEMLGDSNLQYVHI